MRGDAGMTVLAPADEHELVSMMDWAQAMNGRSICAWCVTRSRGLTTAAMSSSRARLSRPAPPWV